MGRQQYLLRLALGRAAFEPVVDEPNVQESITIPHDLSAAYTQQYDAHGHPRNPLTKELDDAQIRAKNAVLETIGICERNSKQADPYARLEKIVHDEDMAGLNLDRYTDWIRALAQWYLVGLQGRILCGLVDCNVPFLQLLNDELRRSSPLTTMVQCFGSHNLIEAAVFYHQDAMEPLTSAIGGRLALWHGDASPGHERVYQALVYGFYIFAMIMLLNPLLVYRDLMELGIYQGFAPPLEAFLPWKAASPFPWAFGADSGVPARLLSMIYSPIVGAFGLQYTRMWFRPYECVEEKLSIFRHDRVRVSHQPGMPRPLGVRRSNVFQYQALEILGWAPPKHDQGGACRMTGLSILPSRVASMCLALGAWAVFSLPIRNVYLPRMLDMIAKSPVTSNGTWSMPGKRFENSALAMASKMGLCILANLASDACIWTALYGITRTLGIYRFEWRRT